MIAMAMRVGRWRRRLDPRGRLTASRWGGQSVRLIGGLLLGEIVSLGLRALLGRLGGLGLGLGERLAARRHRRLTGGVGLGPARRLVLGKLIRMCPGHLVLGRALLGRDLSLPLGLC